MLSWHATVDFTQGSLSHFIIISCETSANHASWAGGDTRSATRSGARGARPASMWTEAVIPSAVELELLQAAAERICRGVGGALSHSRSVPSSLRLYDPRYVCRLVSV